jgi:transcriptional regulator with XRE-family HTH domain
MSRRVLGLLLAEARRKRGYSQLRLAELLCAAAGTASVTRHEVSRWERGERLPGASWLAWLALVLDIPPGRLTAAARSSRAESRPAKTASMANQLCLLAGRWWHDASTPSTPDSAAAGNPDDPVTGEPLVDDLRRMDDLIGGADLAATAMRHWRAGLGRLGAATGTKRRGLLRPVAELAQLAGWTAADAGDHAAALRAYRAGLMLAWESGDRPFGAHLLGSASHLLADREPRLSWRLARIAASGSRRDGSVGLRALLAQRAAFAAARSGDARAAQDALLIAQRLGERLIPAGEPSWLYWLDSTELAAMTGRCLVALDRPLRALPLLWSRHTTASRRHPRTNAVYSGWLARALLGVGELEQACAVGTTSVLETVRSGSVRAAVATRELSVRLAPRRDAPVVRELSELISSVRWALPVATGPETID